MRERDDKLKHDAFWVRRYFEKGDYDVPFDSMIESVVDVIDRAVEVFESGSTRTERDDAAASLSWLVDVLRGDA